MKIINNLSKFTTAEFPIALTIGNFDGVHLGHQALLNRLRQVANHTTVITFSNHPSQILHNISISYLTTLSHRLSLFEKIGIDTTILIPFSESFSKQSAETFLINLKKNIPFNYLILGHDAVIGHDRKNNLYDLSKQLVFTAEYLDPIFINEKIVSSSEIRKYIQSGKLSDASRLLGRPYSIFATVQPGCGKGRSLGFHTANLPIAELALPPIGVYIAEVRVNDKFFPAVANLGKAPTVHENRPLCLEVHLINEHLDLYDKEIEVFFLNYLRPEKCFKNSEALKSQIKEDISNAEAFMLSRERNIKELVKN